MAAPKRELFLILRAQTGDAQALDELLQSSQDTLSRYLLRLVGDQSSAEDVLQDVCLIICRKIRWLEQPQYFRAWMFRIASRAAFRFLRRERPWRNRVQSEDILETIASPEVEVYAPDLANEIPSILAQLSPASRSVLILHYLEDLSLGEVAEVLDLPLGTVKSRLAYGLSILRQRLTPETHP